MTVSDLTILRAYAETGDIAAAAQRLGMSPQTVKNRLSRLYRRRGCVSGVQAIWLLYEELRAA